MHAIGFEAFKTRLTNGFTQANTKELFEKKAATMRAYELEHSDKSAEELLQQVKEANHDLCVVYPLILDNEETTSVHPQDHEDQDHNQAARVSEFFFVVFFEKLSLSYLRIYSQGPNLQAPRAGNPEDRGNQDVTRKILFNSFLNERFIETFENLPKYSPKPLSEIFSESSCLETFLKEVQSHEDELKNENRVLETCIMQLKDAYRNAASVIDTRH